MAHVELRSKQREKSLLWHCQTKIHLATSGRDQYFSKHFQPSLPLFEATMSWWLLAQESQRRWGFRHGPQAKVKVWLQAGSPTPWEATAPVPRTGQGMRVQCHNPRGLRRHQGSSSRLMPTQVSGQARTCFLARTPAPAPCPMGDSHAGSQVRPKNKVEAWDEFQGHMHVGSWAQVGVSDPEKPNAGRCLSWQGLTGMN